MFDQARSTYRRYGIKKALGMTVANPGNDCFFIYFMKLTSSYFLHTGRYRNCSKESKGYGKTCKSLGPRIETKKCFLRECPIDGHPGAWENWGPCDKDCKDGKRSRKRICNNPRPKYFGLPCQEAMNEFQKCPNEKPCKEDGKYGWWSKWSECSANCGKGTQTRERKCTPPVGGGKPCEKGSVEKVTGDCFIKDCATEKPKVTPTKKTETTKKVENNAVATKKT